MAGTFELRRSGRGEGRKDAIDCARSVRQHRCTRDFAFYSQSGKFIRVRPCGGDRKLIKPVAVARVEERSTKPLTRIVVNLDLDESVDVTAGEPLQPDVPAARSLENWFKPVVSSVATTDEGDLILDNEIQVCLVCWHSLESPAPGLPIQQTLERLVSAAIVAAYPARAVAVQTWLDSRPAPPSPSSKAHAWSYMAGWFPKHGCEDFFRQVWRDPAIAVQLQRQLQGSGASRIAELIAQ